MSMAILSPIWVLAVFSFTCGNGGLLHTEAYSSDQTYRTAYHFQPPSDMMKAPNGPMRYRGVYHLFYAYFSWSTAAIWAHSVSNDLVNWTPLDFALFPSEPFDSSGCGSGSATILVPEGKPAILYSRPDHAQNLAYPRNVSDPFLREWVKSPKNPVISPTSASKSGASNLSDPTTAWIGKDGYWRVLLGGQNQSQGMAVLYRSQDFENWVEADDPFCSVQGIGAWSYPDFYPVLINNVSGVDVSMNGPDGDVRHVLKVSLADKQLDYYLIGTYDAANDVFVPNRSLGETFGLRYDYGKYYASKTFFDDGNNRRILFGWINESSSLQDDLKKEWSGIQAIPRSIWLHKSGKQLVQWPVVEIEKLRTNPINLPPKVLKRGELLKINGVTASQADVEISFQVSDFGNAEGLSDLTDPQTKCSERVATIPGGIGPFGLFVFASNDLLEYTAVFLKIFKYQNQNLVLMCSDQSRSSLNKDNDRTTYGAYVDVDPAQEKLSLRSLIDHSVVESFAGEGRSCITARVYPTLAINDKANLYAFNYGKQDVNVTSLSAWSMKKAQINGN